MSSNQTAELVTTREALERRISEIQEEQHQLAAKIGQHVVKGLELSQLRARRRELHEEIQDCFDALCTIGD